MGSGAGSRVVVPTEEVSTYRVCTALLTTLELLSMKLAFNLITMDTVG